MFEHSGSSDGLGLEDDEDDDDKHAIPTIKGPLEFIRHPQVHLLKGSDTAATNIHGIRICPSTA